MLHFNSKRRIAIFLVIIMLNYSLFPYAALALTGGPSQPEVQSFEPAGTSEMVDLSTGTFTYNIPLLDVGGYPVNISYNAGASMDQEASCVGLGWNINPGVINRNMRGLPDDFDGEDIEKEFNIKDNQTWGANIGVDLELFGFDKVKPGLQAGIFFNSYKGMGLEFGLGASPSLSAGSKAKDGLTGTLGLNLNFNVNSQNGVSAGIQPSLQFSDKPTDKESRQSHKSFGLSGGLSFNSRQGLLAANLGANMSHQGVWSSSKNDDPMLTKFNGTANFSFARPTYTPSAGMPMTNFSFTYSGAGQVPIYGLDPGVSFSMYSSKQGLTSKKIVSKGYGTLYLQNQQPGVSLLDFNREKDGPFTNNTPNLAIPIATQDIYSVAGQGIGGSYLLKRGDVGVFSDKQTSITSGSASLGIDLGAASLLKGGVNISGVGVEAKTGAWKGSDNLLASNLAFKGGTSGSLYEPAYFKQAGEQSVESDPALFDNLGGFDVIDAKIGKDATSSDKFKVQVKPFFRRGARLKDLPSNGTGINSLISRSKRERRNQNISYLTAKEASEFGLQKNIEVYPINTFTGNPSLMQRFDATIRKEKHISEVTALREDGVRYIYGVPAYNIKQEDYTFSVSGAGDCSKGLVTYNGTIERGPNNLSGNNPNTLARDNFYSKEVTPAYAHSYLLSAVISPDYSDVDNINGPSQGDLGSYTKFNYSRANSSYKWRLPYPDADNRANYNPGLLSNPYDDRGSVVYGEKEIWQLHSIESKTHVARFTYSLRSDGIGVSDIDIALNNLTTGAKLYRLDKIELYSKIDLATPIKTVFFEYDYILCQGLPNSNGATAAVKGKLTLTKIFFTYGISQKGRFSPYVFTYAGASVDSLKYNYQGYNRWGSFQLSQKTTSSCNAFSSPLGNDDFPYVKQDSLLQARYAVAWNLTKIKLPSGGEIDVTYEAHDYAYVQDKNAMQMFIIDGLGISTDRPSTPSGDLFSAPPVSINEEKVQYDYVYFRLKKKLLNTAYTAQQAKDLLARDYLKDIITKGNLYFKCLVDLKTAPTAAVPHYEYVYGYADIVDWGRCTNSEDFGFVRLSKVCLKDRERGSCPVSVNPISKAGWQFTRLNYPDLIHSTNMSALPTGSQTVTSALKALEAMTDLFKQVQTTLLGPNRYCLHFNYSQKLLPTKSWIRLYCPDGKKSAGGSRVKRITITDSWKEMTSNTVDDIGKYGQEFTYRTEADLGKNIGDGITKRQISSGVATYEPMIGGDENPYRQPVTYDETLRLAPDNSYYQESPFGESFFPSPQIIYSKVAVTTLRYDKAGLLATPQCVSTGQTISEYYTARDYPTRVSKTPIQVIATKSSPLASFLKLDYKDYLNASQGFCVELNDMSGKPKAQWNFDDKGTRISGVEYIYKSKKKDSDPTIAIRMDPVTDSLDNRALVINRNGDVRYSQIGVDFQVVADSRESSNETRSMGTATNVDAFVFGIFPAAAIVPWPIFEVEKTRFRSMAISKVINRYALLEKVVAYDASSRIETENLAYDAETGEVLLTRTYNEFGDPIYKLKYPAHFAYTGMRQAYENAGVEVSGVNITVGAINYGSRIVLNAQQINLFHQGDEISITDNGQPAIVKKGWVLNVDAVNNSLDVIGKLGEDLIYANNPALTIKVIRSGRRNQQSAEIGMVTLKSNPIDLANNRITIPSGSVLDASVTEYSDNWLFKNIRGCTNTTVNDGTLAKGTNNDNLLLVDVTNPFAFERRGVWRPFKSWSYLTDCNPESPAANYQTNIRTSGTFKSFDPFWTAPSTSATNPIWGKSTTNWTWSSEATKYDAYGFQLESKDPLGRYSAELPGYGNTQAIAVAANARYKEIVFNGFEENSVPYRMCTVDTVLHFPRITGGTVVSTFSHTGDYSLNVPPSGNATHTVRINNFTPSLDVLTPAPIRETRLASVNNLTGFGMIKDSVYLVSAWVRTDEAYAINKTTYKQANNLNPRIEVKRHNGATAIATVVLHPTGNVIDGWQRIVGFVTAPPLVSGQPYIVFEFKNGTGSNAYFDDFRVQPYHSAMKAYVYDQKSTRLLATLDDENYATFYEYNQEGTLERVKRETERGIMTIQENRTGIKKQ